jgi:hypothetical protein
MTQYHTRSTSAFPMYVPFGSRRSLWAWRALIAVTFCRRVEPQQDACFDLRSHICKCDSRLLLAKMMKCDQRPGMRVSLCLRVKINDSLQMLGCSRAQPAPPGHLHSTVEGAWLHAWSPRASITGDANCPRRPGPAEEGRASRRTVGRIIGLNLPLMV